METFPRFPFRVSFPTHCAVYGKLTQALFSPDKVARVATLYNNFPAYNVDKR